MDNNYFNGKVEDIAYLGKISIYRVKLEDDSIIEVTSPNSIRPRDGNLVIDWDDEVFLSWDASSAVVLTK